MHASNTFFQFVKGTGANALKFSFFSLGVKKEPCSQYRKYDIKNEYDINRKNESNTIKNNK